MKEKKVIPQSNEEVNENQEVQVTKPESKAKKIVSTIINVILVLAIGLKYGTGDVQGIAFSLGSVSVTLSGLAVAAIVGIAMNAILPGKDYEFGANDQGDKAVNFGPRYDEDVEN